MKPRSYRKPFLPGNAKRVFEGTIFDVYQWEQELYDGSMATFERASRQDTAIVFPILEDGRILLTEDSQPDRETVIGAPGGRIEDGETPEEGARRELLEETGLEAASYELFSTVRPQNKLDWLNYVYIAHQCKKVQEPMPDPGEKITPLPVTFDELMTLAAEGKFREGEFRVQALEAKLDSKKMEALRKAFSNRGKSASI